MRLPDLTRNNMPGRTTLHFVRKIDVSATKFMFLPNVSKKCRLSNLLGRYFCCLSHNGFEGEKNIFSNLTRPTGAPHEISVNPRYLSPSSKLTGQHIFHSKYSSWVICFVLRAFCLAPQARKKRLSISLSLHNTTGDSQVGGIIALPRRKTSQTGI